MSVVIRRRTDQGLFVANCPASVSVGDMVYISGPQVGDYYQVSLCNIDEYGKRTAGMVVSKQTSTICAVQYSGLVSGIYTGLTPNVHMFLGENDGGRLVQFVPLRVAANDRYVEIVGKALSDDVILMEIQSPKVIARDPSPPISPSPLATTYGSGVYGGA